MRPARRADGGARHVAMSERQKGNPPYTQLLGGAGRADSARTARRRHRDVLLAEAKGLAADNERLGSHVL